MADLGSYLTLNAPQFFCRGGFRSVADSCDVISCVSYAEYYYYIFKCEGVWWAAETEYVSGAGVYCKWWGVDVRWTEYGVSYWVRDVTPDRGSPGEWGNRCGLLAPPTAV